MLAQEGWGMGWMLVEQRCLCLSSCQRGRRKSVSWACLSAPSSLSHTRTSIDPETIVYQIWTAPPSTYRWGKWSGERVEDWIRLCQRPPARLPLPAAFQCSRFPLVSPPLFTGSLSLVIFISLCSSPHSASLRILTVTCMNSTMTLYLSLICAFSASCFWTSFGSVAPD